LTGAGWAGLSVVLGLATLALAGPWLARYRVTALSGAPLQPPGFDHWLGTNSVGQDLASQWLLGARASLEVALVGGGATIVLATAAGTVAGWLGGLADGAIMRVVDFVLVIPPIPLVIVISAYTRPSLLTLSAIIAVTSWPVHARVIRAQVLSLRQRGHVRAAVGFGASTGQVLRRHVLPESGLIVVATLIRAAERAIGFEAGLAFLGLSVSPHGSWGTMMREALNFQGLFFTRSWAWWLLPPVIAVSLLLAGLALVGTAVDERVNPRLAQHCAGPLGRQLASAVPVG
jgi:ABC-type dipeptide/oligopeptide/nickel transport system permease subunit